MAELFNPTIKEGSEAAKKQEEEKKFKDRYTHIFGIANEERNKTSFPSNEVKTSKYNNAIMLFKAFLAQLLRLPVIYYVVIIILEAIPSISPYSPIPTFVLLVFVVCLAVVRELFEDTQRYFADLATNTTPTVKYRNGSWTRVGWKDLYVGDVIRIKQFETIPADCVCLASANESHLFGIQTQAIDGKTKLSRRRAIAATSEIIGNGEVYRLVGEAEFFQVSESIHEFDGLLLIGDELDIDVNELNFLPRGAVLRNTEWVIAVVGFTGADCKIFMNYNPSLKLKSSKVQSVIDIAIIAIIGFQLIFSIVMAVLAGIWFSEVGGSYRTFTGSTLEDWQFGFLNLLSFFILSSQMVPLILILCLELVRSTLGWFVRRDELMYDPESSTYPRVQNSSIIEELGQVKYVVADKTGTLTSNKFQLKLFMAGTEIYGDMSCLSESMVGQGLEEDIIPQDQTADTEYVFHDLRLNNLLEDYLPNNDKLDMVIKERHTSRVLFQLKEQKDLVKELLLECAVLNSCEVVLDPETNETSYFSLYPDEVASVDLAKKLGVELLEAGSFFKRVNFLGKLEYFEIVKNIRYNSLRRRSTILVKQGELLKLYCKGIPEVIYQIQDHSQDERFNEASGGLLGAANDRGLRSICYGMRIVTETELKEFNARLEKASKMDEGPDKEAVISRLS